MVFWFQQISHYNVCKYYSLFVQKLLSTTLQQKRKHSVVTSTLPGGFIQIHLNYTDARMVDLVGKLIREAARQTQE